MTAKEILKKYKDPKNFFNRDLSWVEFNRRVMEEAMNSELPLLEKIKFISIFFSNLDEFYMIRVSGLKEQVAANILEPTIDGLTPLEQIQKIDLAVKPLVKQLSDCWVNEISPELKKNNIFLFRFNELNPDEQKKLRDYFQKEIYPILTPLAFDPGRPFPYISNLSLSLAVLIRNPKGESHFARVKVPSTLPRLLQIDDIIDPDKKVLTNGSFQAKFIWMGDFIEANLSMLFSGMEVVEAHIFRITRDTDIEVQEDEADDLLSVIEENIRQRRFGQVIRLEVESAMPDYMLETLIENLRITPNDVHIADGPIGLSDVMELYKLPVHQLKEKPFYPVLPKTFETDEDIFTIIKQKDILLHHPYHSFTPVIEFIKQSARDPDVLAIKQTLYRVGADSPIVKALIEAAERGKQVAVLVELKARFDEENNIFWARELEKVGAHVVYGLVGLKTHAKMTLVVRKEFEGVKRYVHLATGNYNAITAKLYTDIGLFTNDEDICGDVSDVFNYLTGYSKQKDYKKLIVSPVNMREKMLDKVFREIENVKAGSEGKIIWKMNSLVDPAIISALYEASNSGVKIDLIVRGICCLVPGIEGLSKNIKVRSIVGRYLEHSRVFYFYNNGNEEVILGSADMMQRNLNGRVETMFPVEDENLRKELMKTLMKVSLKDNLKARELLPDMSYKMIVSTDGEKNVNSQEWLMKHAVKNHGELIKT
ncbi:MAG: polyphosphate kinase 1 [Ignavibacteria bacterium]|nr:polyphosphate kinase 1 [Ignavibacteria bacterium]MBT8382543.1 polyphosphate kinase 1 [Ignavibacteria bacterium]MBT8392794.1 polyphosphate kinase 1 [Ignavibacteria bacterium]NNJ54355.1 polyphosphate kinase 1 [Ignavibacteriaceae bacterium]NNL20528.1 polyphosphate kinase 1 [Ignavibacteriaceae bacterium]